MVPASHLELRILLMPEGFGDGSVGYTAQCLEYDIATQAKGIRDAVYELYRAVTSTLLLVQQGEMRAEDLHESPSEYARRFEHAYEIVQNIRLELESMQMGPEAVLHVRIAA